MVASAFCFSLFVFIFFCLLVMFFLEEYNGYVCSVFCLNWGLLKLTPSQTKTIDFMTSLEKKLKCVVIDFCLKMIRNYCISCTSSSSKIIAQIKPLTLIVKSFFQRLLFKTKQKWHKSFLFLFSMGAGTFINKLSYHYFSIDEFYCELSSSEFKGSI